MEKEMMKLEDLRNMKCTLIGCLKSQVDGNIQGLDVNEAGEVVDMIKDLAETEKYCMEAKYYETVIQAMEEGSEYEKSGYNNRRYQNGQYAPNGAGHYGYRPMVDQEPYVWDYLDRMTYGYNTNGSNGNSRASGSGNGGSSNGYRMGYHYDMMYPSNERYSRAVNDYRTAKRHYTETNSPTDKEQMDMYTNEHMTDTISTLREMWDDADTELKKRMKNDLSSLLSEMTV